MRMNGEGWSCQRLAERYGCDDETVHAGTEAGRHQTAGSVGAE